MCQDSKCKIIRFILSTDKKCTLELVHIHLFYSTYNLISLSHKSVLVVNTFYKGIVTKYQA